MNGHTPDLHEIAQSVCHEDLEHPGGNYFCGILKHTVALFAAGAPDDFIWIKCKGTHTVQKIRSAYKFVDNVRLQLDGSFPLESAAIYSLDSRGDQVVVFRAVHASSPPDVPTTHTMPRNPLQPANANSSPWANPAYGGSNPRVKPEPGLNDMGENMGRIPHSNGLVANAGFDAYQSEQLSHALRTGKSTRETNQLRPVIKAQWEALSAGQRAPYAALANPAPYAAHHSSIKREVKHEDKYHDDASDNSGDDDDDDDDASNNRSSHTAIAAEKSRLQNLLSTASPEELESEVKKGKQILVNLAKPLATHKESEDARQWLQQVDNLQKQVINTPTIIGVVGNTGSGKSSTINALLDEERLLPTNCMRACTAVVTEISWNSSNDENQKYRGEVEFIKAEEWAKELKLSFDGLLDGNGNVSHDHVNPDTEAGIAYAKIKAVYPLLTLETMAKTTPEKLMESEEVRNILGTTKTVQHKYADTFYQRLNRYVDSKEKSDKNEKKEKGASKQMEFWPLIRVVKIYTKAAALSTGATLVDLPGVHDSNAARSAVAQGYMKQCTGLFVVAPINRAVDDKAAKELLGETFKRQLKYDGTYSRVTFICSKTDDISITEAADSLGIQDEMSGLWEQSDELKEEKKKLEAKIKDLQETKADVNGVFEDMDDQIDTWDALQSQFDEGKTVYAPKEKTKGSEKSKDSDKKRKRDKSPQKQRKKRKTIIDSDDDSDNSAVTESEAEETAADDSEGEADDEEREPLTEAQIESKITELKALKKDARRQRGLIEDQIKEVRLEIKGLKPKIDELNDQMGALCITGRNKYSKTAIQLDFAQGIKELDQENAAEEDEANFDPDKDIRDYDAVASSLKVFCVSARGYQKLCGRLKRDGNVAGFKTAEDTEIPQLQAHCKKLTEEGRASNCRRFLNNLNQLTTSLVLWASNDGSGMNLTDEQKDAEARNLKKKLDGLEKDFDKLVETAIKDLKQTLEDSIYSKYPDVIQVASENAPQRCAKWIAPVNRYDRPSGGYYYATFKAIMRRNGVFTNSNGPHDFNQELSEPIMKRLANDWEKVFSRRIQAIVKEFSKNAKLKMQKFHTGIEKRCLDKGVGMAGISMVKQQMINYETSFAELGQAMVDISAEWQKEASRGFQPTIEKAMTPAYEHCAAECGTGCYMRMKSHMIAHIDNAKSTMFQESCDGVKDLLKQMVRAIDNGLGNGAEETFNRIQRDYMQVVGGVRLPHGQVMSKADRLMRSEVLKILEDSEKVEDGGDDAMLDGSEDSAELQLQNEAADRVDTDAVNDNSVANEEDGHEESEEPEGAKDQLDDGADGSDGSAYSD